MSLLMGDMEQAGCRVLPCRHMKRYLLFPVTLCGMAQMGLEHIFLTSHARLAGGDGCVRRCYTYTCQLHAGPWLRAMP
jgi:hypothetical protein